MSPDEEARRLLSLYGGGADGLPKAMERITQQFLVMQGRTQLLLTLATITLTITGFSGPKIADSGSLARYGLAIGLGLVLIAVVMLLLNLRVRWLSSFLSGNPEHDVAAMLRHRDTKTAWYTAQIALLGLGLASYVGAIIIYLTAHRG